MLVRLEADGHVSTVDAVILILGHLLEHLAEDSLVVIADADSLADRMGTDVLLLEP